ncbi:MAG: histidine kinase dimerization/phospho-acceptor domain-containing protein [Planctomycetota bacterium]
MNAIKGFTSLVARREPTLTDRRKENLEKVSQASDHLMAQINDLLDLSKIVAVKFSSFMLCRAAGRRAVAWTWATGLPVRNSNRS